MKLRSTTLPASISQYAKMAAFLAVIVSIAIGGFMFFNSDAVLADNAKIRRLEAEKSRYQEEAARLINEAASLSNTLAQIANEKNALQAQVNLSQAKHDQLVKEIAATEVKIEENRKALGTTIVDLYAGDTVSPIEMLASSQNIGDFLDKQEYRSSVKDNLNTTIKEVRSLRQQLESQKTEVAQVLTQQKNARDSLAAKEAEQASILAKTRNDEAGFQDLIKGHESEIAHLRAIQDQLNKGAGSIVDSGSLGDYPWNSSNCAMLGWMSTGGADGNGGDGRGYGCRQCASYVAWKVAKETGVYYRWGNGGDFYRNAVAAGYKDLGNRPQPGSLAVILGTPGHVAWVEEVSADGSQVRVSQYNYNYGAGWGMYSNMWMSTYSFNKYVKIK